MELEQKAKTISINLKKHHNNPYQALEDMKAEGGLSNELYNMIYDELDFGDELPPQQEGACELGKGECGSCQ